MKKKIAIVTFEKAACDEYTIQLQKFFNNQIEITGYSIIEGINEFIPVDLIVFSDPTATNFVKEFIPKEASVIYLTRTLLRQGIEKLHQLPKGTKAMMADYTQMSSNYILSLLYEAGIRHIDFFPVHPDMKLEDIPDLDIAVTPGLMDYVPAKAKEVIDIGWTVIELSTIMEIASKLNINNDEFKEEIFSYSSRILPLSQSLVSALKSTSEIKNQWNVVLEVVDDGIIIVDNRDKIAYCNKIVGNIFNINSESLINKSIHEMLPKNDTLQKIENFESIDNMLIEIPDINKSLVITKKAIKVFSLYYGYSIIIKDTTELQRLENKVRKELADRNHTARYKFDDLIGTSSTFLECISKSKKISTLDATLLIIGESGTGKELFAQSIHNASMRKNESFVAINCAALPSNLLESELYGYEGGAFSGAKKGGKKGLFELAHLGTIFLDEIDAIPIGLQAKLLRAIQEKEVMRIGGNNIIPIDVRVIAATNADLNSLMAKEKFRKDLYYRLNVFTLQLPPLRERKEDIPLLAEDCLKKLGFSNKKIGETLMQTLMLHSWDGNVRELSNCIEYMAHMGDDILEIKDLPPYFKTAYANTDEPLSNKSSLQMLLPREKELAKAIIDILSYRNSGRRKILEILLSQNFETTEYEVRRILDYLKKNEYIKYGKGRKGAIMRSNNYVNL